MYEFNPIRCCNFVSLAITIFLGGCSAGVRPDDTNIPDKLTCIEVSKDVEAHDIRGLLDYHWTTRLAKGPYIAEREDVEGTFYRAPPGGIYIGRDDLADKPPVPLNPRNFNGGIWIPRVPGKAPHLYVYFSTQEANRIPLPENASCATAVSVPDPQSKGVSTIAFATGGLIGGAAGGVLARAGTQKSSMSYGGAARVGAAGGALGMLVVGGLINMDVGKIFHLPVPTDPKFRSTLEELTHQIVPVPIASVQ